MYEELITCLSGMCGETMDGMSASERVKKAWITRKANGEGASHTSERWNNLTRRQRKNLEGHGYTDIDGEGYGIKPGQRHPPAVVEWDMNHKPSSALKCYLMQHEPKFISKVRGLNSDIHAAGGYKNVYRMLGGLPGVIATLRGKNRIELGGYEG